MKKIIVFSLFFLFFVGGYGTSQFFADGKIQTILREKNQCLEQINNVSSTSQKNCKVNAAIAQQKAVALEKVVQTGVHFSSHVSHVSATKSEITVQLQGGKDMKVDASDLVMHYSQNLTVLSITSGNAFPIYPRSLAENGVITITGVASIQDSGILMGQPNSTFATLWVEKTGDSKQKGTLIIDSVNSKAFLQGKSVLDLSTSDMQISL